MIEKITSHKRFWQGQGPSLILIPPSRAGLYDLNDYPRRFRDPQVMWKTEMKRAQAVIGWPTDGIPTIRPNLGVITIPAMAGQSFQTPENSMPWPGDPMSVEEIRAIRNSGLMTSDVFKLAADFYQIHRESNNKPISAYLPDTQGVFDIAHLLYGDEIFYSLLDTEEGNWFTELMEISLDLYLRTSEAFKVVMEEDPETMIHGHGTEQGVYFPQAGVRVSEDTATLLSPEMIEECILPYIRRSVQPFGGGFLHYCGVHPTLFDQFTGIPEIKAIDLGNPEKYDTSYLLERCAETKTALYSRIAAEPGEDWREYTNRIGSLVASTGARVILRPLVFPESHEECSEMLELWHELTSK
ncbi:MAG: hypothetical protein Q8N05_14540 [Bacteroidota bacterium]|nr:hypothetical protein [Bacteroidota bacterium]